MVMNVKKILRPGKVSTLDGLIERTEPHTDGSEDELVKGHTLHRGDSASLFRDWENRGK